MNFRNATYRLLRAQIVVSCIAIASTYIYAQTSRWASADDPTAKALIEMERKWATSGCTPNGIEKVILAEDFHGTAPNGTQYSKKEAVSGSQDTQPAERECVMYDVKVHFFGDSIAILYGSESALTKKDGHDYRRKLTWVDTWLKRDGKWQVVAAEDMPSEMK
jgi:Domain of unknown function (DUF4440)